MDSSAPITDVANSESERWAWRQQVEHWRAMTLAQKAALLTSLCRATLDLQLRGLALRYPEASPDELQLRAACQRLGRPELEEWLGKPMPWVDS